MKKPIRNKILPFILFVLIITFFATISEASANDDNPEAPYPRELPNYFEILGLELDSSDFISPNDTEPFSITPKIIGGTTVTPQNKYPWMASLQYYGDHYCGGTLLNSEWVLTSAHCWVDGYTGIKFDVDPAGDKVALGEWSLSKISGNEQFIPIDSVELHPLFNLWTFEYDFALVKLSAPAVLNAYAQPIKLIDTTYSNLYNETATILGWGSVNLSGTIPDTLKEANVRILYDDQCAAYGSAFKPASMLCAGYPEGGIDSCFGDSGGPLAFFDGSEWVQVGIPSWGNSCALPNFPGVYARLRGNTDWILSTVGLKTQRPVTLSPTDGTDFTNTLRPTFEWRQLNPAPHYYKIDIKDSTNALVHTELFTASNVCNSYKCVAPITSDLAEHNGYSWTIRGYNGDTIYSLFSWSKTFDISPFIIKLAPPYGEIITVPRPEFQWKNVPWNAYRYELQVTRKVNGNPVTTYNYDPLASAACSGTTCAFRVTDDYTFGVFAWKLRAYKPSIGWISYGGEWNIVMNSQIPFIYPRNNDTVNTATPTFEWEDLDWVDDYEIMIRDSTNLNTLLRTVLSADSVCSLGQCDWTLAGLTLQDLEDYVWYVRGISSTYGTGPWGPKKTFTADY